MYVVYLYIPTSNHNRRQEKAVAARVVYLYIPTSNHNWVSGNSSWYSLYIFIFLHQTTTNAQSWIVRLWLYIFIFLHQTTTRCPLISKPIGCISLYSYIKPQHPNESFKIGYVVYLYIPTSNHNTPMNRLKLVISCISLYSYIKPQPKETNILIIR